MLLHVMRHGPAEDRAPSGRDFDRSLTPAGREVVVKAARALDESRQPFGGRSLRLLASPFRRARETAELVAAALAVEVELHEDLGADASTPLGLVRELSAAGTDVLLVGHQPFVEDLVRALVHPVEPPLRGGFRTALIVTLARAASEGWEIGPVLDPHRLHDGET